MVSYFTTVCLTIKSAQTFHGYHFHCQSSEKTSLQTELQLFHELHLWYGTMLVMLLFYSLLTNQATTYKNETKESVHFAFWTTLVMTFLRKVFYDFKRTIK